MQIIVTRVDGHRYSTILEQDGVRLRILGYGFMRALPHDLAYFVVKLKATEEGGSFVGELN